MTTKTKAPPKQLRKPKDEKFRVIPNLTMRGKDIMTRIQNRTLIPGYDGQYTLDEQFAQMKGKSKIDIAREYIKEGKNINNLQNKLADQESKFKSDKEKAEKAKMANLENELNKYKNAPPHPKT